MSPERLAVRRHGRLHRGRAGVTLVEAAALFALCGTLLAVAIPVFARELHASRLVEPVDGLARIGAAAVAYARDRDPQDAFPPSAPLTPPVVPRGTGQVDPPGTWDTPTWRALRFSPALPGHAHAFSFSFESAATHDLSSFVARAHGDLDGDGVTSTFEVTGRAARGSLPQLDPGMYVEAEVE